MKELTKEKAAEAEKARAAENAKSSAEQEKKLLEQKMARLEQSSKEEAEKLRGQASKEGEELQAKINAAEARALSAGAELDEANRAMEEMRAGTAGEQADGGTRTTA